MLVQEISSLLELPPVQAHDKLEVSPGSIKLFGKLLGVHFEFEDVPHRAEVCAHW